MSRSILGLLPILLALVYTTVPVLGSRPANEVNLIGAVISVDDEDDIPEVTDRVARVSAIDGAARIRRNGSEEWEAVTANLPLVEGDEIATDAGARLEVQFDKNKHLRLDENSHLRLSTLKDNAIAVSLSVGTLSLRITAFDKDQSFFEIDAPKTTLAIQRAGRYQVEAGREGETEVRAVVTEGGEARLYTENDGFTLKSGRAMRLQTEGQNAGEWEILDASRQDDEFSQWVSVREEVVAKRLKAAQYDKYYDDDLYGADDLTDHGEWIYAPGYGYVWRPYGSAISSYSDWSPYRYGHWRWMNPFGWIWVNDEPWGWATYHHGRWFYLNGHWVWSPYGYYRTSRSWWSPALVVINIFNNNVYWYPLPYHRRRYNYNWRDEKGRNAHTRTPPPRSTPVGVQLPPGRLTKGKGDDVPAIGIVNVNPEDFGKRSMRVKTATPAIAKTVLTGPIGDGRETRMPIKPSPREIGVIAVEPPKVQRVAVRVPIGAAPRKSDNPMDTELRTTRIFGGRPPKTADGETRIREPLVRTAEPRKTGVVDRPPVTTQPERVNPEPQRRVTPRSTPIIVPDRPTPPRETPKPEAPRERPRIESTPRNEAPKTTPKSESPKSQPKPAERPAPPTRKDKPDTR